MTRLARLDGPATAALRDQLVAVYRAAMGAPPFSETEVETGWFAQELADELGEPGFRCWVASEDDRVVGFAYGYETPGPLPLPGFQELGRGPWAGTTPNGSCSGPSCRPPGRRAHPPGRPVPRPSRTPLPPQA